MKRLLGSAAIIALTLLLAACGNGGETDESPADQSEGQPAGENEQMDNASENDGGTDQTTGANDEEATTSSQSYGFTQFSVEADIDGTRDAVEVEYEQENDTTEASYQDENAGIQLKGDEAMEELDSIFTEFTFDESTPEEEVAQEVAQAFNIPEDAEEFEVEIEFDDQNELEYERN
ncbi:YusW family protein [Virgibacillus xinjiangensis]|uniref:YusW family protein n=1 Tax=Virgibacillus xinjiangensis TaxID=393090 RepID=A0ABV7CQL1_9BACI